MKLDTRRAPTVVEEVPWGLYIWVMPNGQWVGDDEGNFLNIKAMKGDVQKVKMLQDAVRSYGIEEGRAEFLSGHRQIDDEEFEKQKFRAYLGLIPDELDAPAFAESLETLGR